jgi:hypothetical protein
VFCPKAVAGIGELPDTVADRSIPIRLRRRAKSEPLARFRRRDAACALDPIRSAFEEWAASVDLREARPHIPDELEDRAADSWEPLLAIADEAGGGWPSRARSAALALSVAREEAERSIGVRLLADVRRVFDERAAGTLFSRDLISALNAFDESPWGAFSDGTGIDARGLARLLRPYGVRPRDVRIGSEHAKGFSRDSLTDAWVRYCADPPSDQFVCDTVTPEEDRAVTGHPSPESVAVADVCNRAKSKDCHGVTADSIESGGRDACGQELDLEEGSL